MRAILQMTLIGVSGILAACSDQQTNNNPVVVIGKSNYQKVITNGMLRVDVEKVLGKNYYLGQVSNLHFMHYSFLLTGRKNGTAVVNIDGLRVELFNGVVTKCSILEWTKVNGPM